MLLNADGIRGFPVVLQQISKILNYSLMAAGQTKSGELLFSLFFSPGLRTLGQHQTSLFPSHLLSIESTEEKGGGLPRCSIAELLQMCWPSLTEDCAASHATLSQQLDQVLQSLREALELPGTGPSVWEQMGAELGRGNS